jgi:hypothetical protein
MRGFERDIERQQVEAGRRGSLGAKAGAGRGTGAGLPAAPGRQNIAGSVWTLSPAGARRRSGLRVCGAWWCAGVNPAAPPRLLLTKCTQVANERLSSMAHKIEAEAKSINRQVCMLGTGG